MPAFLIAFFFKDLFGPRCFEYIEKALKEAPFITWESLPVKSRGPSLRQKRGEQKNTPNSLIFGHGKNLRPRAPFCMDMMASDKSLLPERNAPEVSGTKSGGILYLIKMFWGWGFPYIHPYILFTYVSASILGT